MGLRRGGCGSGHDTGVVAGTDLTGGGSGVNVTLNIDITKVPQLFRDTSGSSNSSYGEGVLLNNASGYSNFAGGVSALGQNTTGMDNKAVGVHGSRIPFSKHCGIWQHGYRIPVWRDCRQLSNEFL